MKTTIPMTKAEQILAGNNYHPSNLLESDRDALLKSMRDVVTKFNKWAYYNNYEFDGVVWYKYKRSGQRLDITITTDELYNLYNNQTDKR